MLYNDFTSEGFYYNQGKDLVGIDDILEAPNGNYYKVILDNSTNQVFLKEGGSQAIIEPTRGFLEECYPPLDVNRIPSF